MNKKDKFVLDDLRDLNPGISATEQYLKNYSGIITLRDLFAGVAMGHMIQAKRDRSSTVHANRPDIVATMSYQYADAMLKERDKNAE